MQVTKGTLRLREQCVPGSLSSSPAREPGNEASKLTIYSRKFLALPAVLVVHFAYNTLVKAWITLCLERQCAVQ